jgi:hypothetical protein
MLRSGVMAGFSPTIHDWNVAAARAGKTWMPGMGTGMTESF